MVIMTKRVAGQALLRISFFSTRRSRIKSQWILILINPQGIMIISNNNNILAIKRLVVGQNKLRTFCLWRRITICLLPKLIKKIISYLYKESYSPISLTTTIIILRKIALTFHHHQHMMISRWTFYKSTKVQKYRGKAVIICLVIITTTEMLLIAL